jgi:hypothetical protein
MILNIFNRKNFLLLFLFVSIANPFSTVAIEESVTKKYFNIACAIAFIGTVFATTAVLFHKLDEAYPGCIKRAAKIFDSVFLPVVAVYQATKKTKRPFSIDD